jgi:hypothetical protein
VRAAVATRTEKTKPFQTDAGLWFHSVASPIGANRDVVRDGETGVFACDDPE